MQSLVKHQIYHKINLLDPADFHKAIQHKENVINAGQGATTFHEDGTVTINNELKKYAKNPEGDHYTTSKDAIVNFQCNIENFIKIYGEPFYPIFTKVQNALIDIGVDNPRPYTARAYRHNNPHIPWHKHSNVFKIKPSELWIAIFYLHPNWDTKYGGGLRVGLCDTEDLLVADCLSNSVIIHNGYYGHGVLKLHQGFEGDRDILLTQWVSESGYKDVFC